MKNFFIRIMPYVISMSVGITIYALSGIYLKDSALNDLNVNIAAGLMSIPLVFISYEVFNNLSNKKLKDSLQRHLLNDINDTILNIIANLRTLLSQTNEFSPEELDIFLNMDAANIKKNIKMDDTTGKNLQADKEKLTRLASGGTNVLANTEIEHIFNISSRLGVLAKEIIYRDKIKDKKTLTDTTAALLKELDDWVDIYQDEIVNHHSFKLVD
ncbi:hypothetical protein AAIR98_001501 [Elusimicrobium simillimum]|uniref:hypothetical protein n=1 Tax=Elusimicrobium simillimum TaxID=3143438 RepID=UPI003C6F2F97